MGFGVLDLGLYLELCGFRVQGLGLHWACTGVIYLFYMGM